MKRTVNDGIDEKKSLKIAEYCVKIEKMFSGDEKMKKLSNVTIIKIIAIIVMLAALFSASVGSIQSSKAFLLPIKFRGEYSLDNGKMWETLPDAPHISAAYSSVILKGVFGGEVPEGRCLNFFLDHITMEIYINGEQFLWDSANEIGLTDSTCGRKWINWVSPGISEDDVVEIRLANLHRFGNSNAYNELLENIYGGTEDIFDSFMLKTGQKSRIIGTAVMVAAIMLLAGALFFGLLHIDGGVTVGNLGALALFFGGYFILDTIDLPLWSWHDAFNTYALQICIMLASTCALTCIAESISSKASKTARPAVIASGAVNSVLALLSIFDVMVIYDTQFFWLMAHISLYAVMLGCCIYECASGSVKNRFAIISDILLIAAAFGDIVCFFLGAAYAGICSKTTFLVLFLIHLVQMIRVIPMNYKAAREAEQLKAELAENRISIMLSQIQPHFLYNSLNTIYGLCEKDPSTAKKAVNDFADYLRGNMDCLSRKNPVPFETELKHLRSYISLEEMRFRNKLEIVWDIETSSFMLPALTVQPLVENAVKHGICKADKVGTIKISARELPDCFEIEVTDNGVGFDVNNIPDDGRSHLGIENVRNRLWKMCGATLEISSEIGKGTSAVIHLPKKNTEEIV
ncbi:MAG: sensor histidine kinase [Huintestinicola sp.]